MLEISRSATVAIRMVAITTITAIAEARPMSKAWNAVW